MNTDQAHLYLTYSMFAFFLMVAIAILIAGLSSRITFGSLSMWQRPLTILASIVSVIYALGCLSGVGIERHDNYYVTHPAPWPAARIFSGIAWVITITIGVVHSIKRWINSPRYD